MFHDPGTFLCRDPSSSHVRIRFGSRLPWRTAADRGGAPHPFADVGRLIGAITPGGRKSARVSAASGPVVAAAAAAADPDSPPGSGAAAAWAARVRPHAAFRLACRQRDSSTSHTSVWNGSGWAPCPADSRRLARRPARGSRTICLLLSLQCESRPVPSQGVVHLGPRTRDAAGSVPRGVCRQPSVGRSFSGPARTSARCAADRL